MNPLFNSLNQGVMPSVPQNPMSMLTEMAKSNPSLQPIVNAISGGMSPEAIVRNECRRRGIDVNELLKQIPKV